MKLPEQPPNWHAILSKNTDWFFENINNDDLVRIAHQASKEYIFWDKVKYITLPKDITPELFWLSVDRRSAKKLTLYRYSFGE